MTGIKTSPFSARTGSPAAEGIHGVVSSAGERGTVPRAFAHVTDNASQIGIALGELVEVYQLDGAGLQGRELTGLFLLTDGRHVEVTVRLDRIVVAPPPSFRSVLEESLS